MKHALSHRTVLLAVVSAATLAAVGWGLTPRTASPDVGFGPAYSDGYATAEKVAHGLPLWTSAYEVCAAWSSEGNGPKANEHNRRWIAGCERALLDSRQPNNHP